MKCRTCEHEMRKPDGEYHCRERSPVDPELCLGCWIGEIQMELFLIRAGAYVGINGRLQLIMKEMLSRYEKDEEFEKDQR